MAAMTNDEKAVRELVSRSPKMGDCCTGKIGQLKYLLGVIDELRKDLRMETERADKGNANHAARAEESRARCAALELELDKAREALGHGVDDSLWRPGETAVEALVRNYKQQVEEILAYRRQIDRVVHGKEIESDRLCEHALQMQHLLDDVREELTAAQLRSEQEKDLRCRAEEREMRAQQELATLKANAAAAIHIQTSSIIDSRLADHSVALDRAQRAERIVQAAKALCSEMKGMGFAHMSIEAIQALNLLEVSIQENR